MPVLTRKFLFSAAAACFALILSGAPAAAATHHKHRSHHVVRHHAKGSEILRIAQRHLYNLGYYTGEIDGLMGSQTRHAIQKFQREHWIKATGKLDGKTSAALENADHGHYGQLGTHETVGTTETAPVVNDDFAASINGGTRVIASRFARLDVSEAGSGPGKRYNVNLNGQPILIADGQPSIIGISQTYDLGNEDAVIFTTFSPNESGCTYRNHVLALSNQGSKLFDLDNCTRGYDAVSKNGSLWITFPQRDSGSAVGDTWRLEGTNLQKL